jgi:dihydrofolate reductase
MPAAASPRITLVAARARNGTIGRDNTLPWHLPEDLAHFKATTLGHPIVMGRRTFESIGRPLPGRRSIVLTRDPAWAHPGCERAGSHDEAIGLCSGAAEVFVVGGAQVYADAIGRADRLILTEVDLDVAGDACFPRIDPGMWRLADTTPGLSRTGLRYSIGTWMRRSDASRATPSA